MTDPEAAVNCRFIVNWGSNTAVTNIHFWKIEHEARKRGAKIVTIDPYRSPTATKPDWWIPIQPGTDRRSRRRDARDLPRRVEDHHFLASHCVETKEMRDRVLSEYPVAKVAAITGLSEEEIEQFARE